MKISKVLVIFVMLILLGGCVTVNLPPKEISTPLIPTEPIPTEEIPTEAIPTIDLPIETPVSVTGLTEEILRNSEYLSPIMNLPVKLVNGEFMGEINGTQLSTVIQPDIQFGDLNRDGVDDAALLLSENTGGSGIFVSLVIIYSDSGLFKQAPGIGIDDRPIINRMVIENNVVKLEGYVHGPNDPMVNPTLAEKQEYQIIDGKIFMTYLTSAFSGGAEHSIVIDTPVEGEEVAGSLRITGSMPIGPFENNLSLIISTPGGQELYHSGFMVQAPDMGAPATFNNSIQLPEIAPGTIILVTLSELSMADGSPMALSMVRVISK